MGDEDLIEEFPEITRQYLIDNPDHIFVYGDNYLRIGKKGAAILRDMENTYGFITKKSPDTYDSSYFNPKEYQKIFDKELKNLTREIQKNKDKTYLISKIGAGLANRYRIFEEIIEKQIRVLEKFENVKFLW